MSVASTATLADLRQQIEGIERIENGDRRVGEGGRIDDDAGGILAGRVDPVDEFVFAVALQKADLVAEFGSDTRTGRLDIGERLVPIDLGLALAEQIEIGAVQNIDQAHPALPCSR